MAIIIDEIENALNDADKTFISEGKSYYGRPCLNGKKMSYTPFLRRFKDIFRVLFGKGVVVYYKEDE